MSTRDLQKIVQALPQYGEQVDKLSTHVEVCLTIKLSQNSMLDVVADSFFFLLYNQIQLAGKINRIIRDTGLRDLGQLEQDLVFGDAGAKDVINFLRTNQVNKFET